jgi:hypothetical protein
MTIKLHISPRIIPSIATLYNDTNRVFMEYIDNSIDSAEEYFDPGTNSYKKNIHIALKVKKDSVEIVDNCKGITNFNKVVQEIGNSDKKAQPWTNGQFGYGIYSFMASCKELKIVSKLDGEAKARTIKINRKQFDTDHQEDVSFPDPRLINYRGKSGTKIFLKYFDKDMWKQIDFNEIKTEVEKHFELLLCRKNLEIKLINEETGTEINCLPFDYAKYNGEEYIDELHDFKFIKGKKHKRLVKFNSLMPVKIYIKVTKGKTISKPPVFITKGRRIAEIKEVRMFKSKHKNDIWGHPNMTGYIDLSDFLEPTIARNDFKNNDRSKALFYELIELEPLIMDVIKEVNKETDDKHYEVLQNKLNKALSRLARKDAMKFRTEFLKGNEVNLDKESGNYPIEQNLSADIENAEDSQSGSEADGNEKDGKNKKKFPLKGEESLFNDSDLKGKERKKSGFNIKIADSEPPLDENDTQLRSQLIGDDVIIYRLHPEFEQRVQKSKKGGSKISQRLVTYLAGEVAVHYKDKLQTRYGQPDYNKKLFENLVEFIYMFENLLKENVGKNLSAM